MRETFQDTWKEEKLRSSMKRATKDSDKTRRDRSKSRDHRSKSTSKDIVLQEKASSREPTKRKTPVKKSTARNADSKLSRSESVEKKHVRNHTKSSSVITEQKLKESTDKTRKSTSKDSKVSADKHLKSSSRKDNVKSNRSDEVNGAKPNRASRSNETKRTEKSSTNGLHAESKHKSDVSVTRKKAAPQKDQKEKERKSTRTSSRKSESAAKPRTESHHKLDRSRSSRHGSRNVPAENSTSSDLIPHSAAKRLSSATAENAVRSLTSLAKPSSVKRSRNAVAERTPSSLANILDDELDEPAERLTLPETAEIGDGMERAVDLEVNEENCDVIDEEKREGSPHLSKSDKENGDLSNDSNAEEDNDEYNYDEDEFEDYDSDFEEESENDESGGNDENDEPDPNDGNSNENHPNNEEIGQEHELHESKNSSWDREAETDKDILPSSRQSSASVSGRSSQIALHDKMDAAKSEQTLIGTKNSIDASDDEELNHSRNSNESSKLYIDFAKARRSSSAHTKQGIHLEPDVKPMTIMPFGEIEKKEKLEKKLSKMRTRADEVLELVTLDTNYFELLDLPPINYETYIKSFGGLNSTQVYVQTDNRSDDECQTLEIDHLDKWTQCPAHDHNGFGGDFSDDKQSGMSSWEFQTKTDILKLNEFVQSVEPVITALLQEDRSDFSIQKLQSNQANISFSDGFVQLVPPDFRKECPVTFVQFSSSQENLLLSIHGTPSNVSKFPLVDDKGIICLWNLYTPADPEKVLMCSSQPLCACFSPVKANLVFAGMVDGSVSVWDLGESLVKHKQVGCGEKNWIVRTASYCTAEVLKDEGHLGAIVSIQTVNYADERASKEKSNASQQVGSASFEVATLEENGIIKFWLVVKEKEPDISGSETDLGLAPSGKVKLVLSSTINLQLSSGLFCVRVNGNKSKPFVHHFVDSGLHQGDQNLLSGMKTHDVQFNPFNPNDLYISTDAGCVVHHTKHGATAVPNLYVNGNGLLCDIQTLDFSPHHMPYFLAGCSDGTLILYCTRSAQPLMTWSNVTGGVPILKVKWSKSQPSLFYALDIASKMHVWDLSRENTGPLESCHFLQGRILNFDLSIDAGSRRASKPVIALAMDDSTLEIHQISKRFSCVSEDRFHELSVSVTSL